MTISTTATKVTYEGNGIATEFGFDFLIPSQAFLQVLVVDADGNTSIIPASAYTVVGINDPDGGAVTYPLVGSPLAAGNYITINRDLPLKQLIAIANQGNFYPSVVESGLDYLMMVAQQLAGLYGRALVVPVTDPEAPSALPPFNQRANQLLGFDADGNPIAAEPSSALVSSAMQPVVAAATLALARSELGLAAMAELGLGRGLIDLAGNATVSSEFVEVGVAQAIDADDHLKRYTTTAAVTFTLPKADTLWNGFGLWIYSGEFTQTVAINAADNFVEMSSGASLSIPPRTLAFISTDGVSVWTVNYSRAKLPIVTPYAATMTPGGRLSLTTGVPVLNTNTTGQSTIFYVPYQHNIVALYDGVIWSPHVFSQLSQALNDGTKSPSAAAANSIYDMFVWNDNGTLRCTRGPAWSSGTARGTGAGTTELELFEGRYVNAVDITNGPAARRGLYVGSIATNASVQCAMNFTPTPAAGGTANRLDVWNMYNRVDVAALCRDSTNTWTYGTKTWRSLNNNANNRVSFVKGLAEDKVSASIDMNVRQNAASLTSSTAWVGIGLNSTSARTGTSQTFTVSNQDAGSSTRAVALAKYVGVPGIGLQFLQALEAAEGVTMLFNGDEGDPDFYQSGLFVETRM